MLGYLFTRILIFVVGSLWPAYRSYQALKAVSEKDCEITREEIFDCLVYWVILGVFSLLEQVSDVIMSWLPFYYEAKALFIIWIALPHFNGSRTLYDCLVHPWLARNEDQIDKAIGSVGSFTKAQAMLAGKKTLSFVQNRGIEMVYAGKKYLEENSSSVNNAGVTIEELSSSDGTTAAALSTNPTSQ